MSLEEPSHITSLRWKIAQYHRLKEYCMRWVAIDSLSRDPADFRGIGLMSSLPERRSALDLHVYFQVEMRRLPQLVSFQIVIPYCAVMTLHLARCSPRLDFTTDTGPVLHLINHTWQAERSFIWFMAPVMEENNVFRWLCNIGHTSWGIFQA